MLVNLAWPKNEKELNGIRKLRNRKAKLLNSDNFATLETNDIGESPKSIHDFILTIVQHCNYKLNMEIDLFEKHLPEGIKLTKSRKIKPWDFLYIKNHYKNKQIKIDIDKLSEYFVYDYTLPAILKVFENLFDIQLKLNSKEYDFWATDVSVITVHKEKNLIGFIILDLFSREHKYASFEEQPVLFANIKNNQLIPGLTVILGSISKPSTGKILLYPSEISSLLHEFGHAIHTLLGPQKINMLSGSQIERSFVELPSQFLEYFLYQPKIIKAITKHQKSDKSMPDKLIKTMSQLYSFDSADITLEQCYFALLSLELFTDPNKSNTTINKAALNATRPYLTYSKYDHSYAAFDHLIGYGSLYYCYLWSKVYAADMFYECAKNIDNKTKFKNIMARYVLTVLNPGDTIKPKIIAKNFLKRDVCVANFFSDLKL